MFQLDDGAGRPTLPAERRNVADDRRAKSAAAERQYPAAPAASTRLPAKKRSCGPGTQTDVADDSDGTAARQPVSDKRFSTCLCSAAVACGSPVRSAGRGQRSPDSVAPYHGTTAAPRYHFFTVPWFRRLYCTFYCCKPAVPQVPRFFGTILVP